MSESGYVLDASALLCLFFRKPGAARVEAVMAGASVSTVSLAEVIAKLVERGADGSAILADVDELDLEIVPLDRAPAETAGLLRATTRALGLSLGEHCCLALAHRLGSTSVTTDQAWAGLRLPGIAIELVR